ncbi:MAG: hypothetical protein K0A89_08190 [ANME-2 cluster archaeon]|nr:hypothetical protein [ANME-2 cluster archaeon]
MICSGGDPDVSAKAVLLSTEGGAGSSAGGGRNQIQSGISIFQQRAVI